MSAQEFFNHPESQQQHQYGNHQQQPNYGQAQPELQGPNGAQEGERGLLGALGGGAAGAFGGHKAGGHGFLGAIGGAIAGHLTEEQVKKHKAKKEAEQNQYAPYDGANNGMFGK